MTTLQKIADLEAEYNKTQKNKATNTHLGLIKAKIAKLKRELLDVDKGSKGGGGQGFDVSKAGDTRVGLVGFPSVGKSTLLTQLTGTFSESADYEFTTLTAVPGSMTYKGAKIQVLDLPGIIEGAKDGKGRGKQVIATARTCNVILLIMDASKPITHKHLVEAELEGFGIRINKKPPNIKFKKKEKGGINLQCPIPQTKGINLSTITAILKEYRVGCADLTFRVDATVDDFIDVVENTLTKIKRVYMPTLYILNKIDAITLEELELLVQLPHVIPLCGRKEWNFDELLEGIWSYAMMIRIYTKPKGQIPDYSAPIVLHAKRPTITQFTNRIHRGLMAQFKYAWVWGMSVKHQPQKVGREHNLADEDVVQIVKKV